MLTIEQKITHLENFAKLCEQNGMHEWKEAPEIIRCKDCKYYEWMSNRMPEEQTWHCHCWDADTGKDDFCSYAERRTE